MYVSEFLCTVHILGNVILHLSFVWVCSLVCVAEYAVCVCANIAWNLSFPNTTDIR